MATGQEQIDMALKTARELSEGWKGRSEDISQRLKKIVTTLEALSGKIFLKTKSALPHTSAISKAVEELRANNSITGNKPSDDFNDALDKLEAEVQILKTKMANKDIVIT